MTTEPSGDVFRPARRAAPGPRARLPRWVRREADVLAVIAAGGGLGSLARYAVAEGVPTRRGAFPWSTFIVNASGSALIGVLMVFVSDVWRPGRYATPLLGIGFLGGFTTYSTTMLDLRTLGADGAWLTADLYLVATVVAGLAVVWLAGIGTRVVAGIPVRRHRHDHRHPRPRRSHEV